MLKFNQTIIVFSQVSYVHGKFKLVDTCQSQKQTNTQNNKSAE